MSEMDNDLTASLAAIDKAAQQDEEESFTSTLRENAVGMVAKAAPSIRWMFNLPKNIGVGTIDAVLESADFLDQVGAAAEQNVNAREQNRPPSSAPPIKPIQPQPLLDPEWRDALTNFRGFMAENAQNPGDVIAQKIAQFAVPFTGWSKLVGGVQGANALRTAAKVVGAESATVATAFDPEEGRMADLLQQGRQLEGRFGDVMRFIAPDGSAANAAIEYLASREGDTEAEGRFKNVIDNLGTTAAFAAVLKTGAAGLRKGREILDDPNRLVSSHWAGKFGRNEEGKIVFHGSGADFDQFDLAYMGTGEGAQAYGPGIYVADSRDVASSYKPKGYERPTANIDAPQSLAHDFFLRRYNETKGNEAAAKAYAEQMVKTSPVFRSPEDKTKALEYIRGLTQKSGKLYTVDVPDKKVAQMLDWDKPLSDEMVAKLQAAGAPTEALARGKMGTGEDFYKALAAAWMPGMPKDPPGTPRGWGYVQRGDEGNKAASDFLQQAGIPGIRYLDQRSRPKGEGTRNYVVFDPADLKIVKKE